MYFDKRFQSHSNPGLIYHLIEVSDPDYIKSIIDEYNLSGFNITIPYKESILPYCNTLSDDAKAVSAINCVKIENQSLAGHNTDIGGFTDLLTHCKLDPQIKALVLGNGGAAKSIIYVLKQKEIDFVIASRHPQSGMIHWNDLDRLDLTEYQIIINCTPIGTWPAVDDTIPIDYTKINFTHICIDLVYNPAKTVFLKLSEAQGAKIMNGLPMLQKQAELSWKFWNLI